MKRIMMVLICVWAMLGVAFAEGAPIAEQDAVKIARDRFLETSGLSAEEIDNFQVSCSYSADPLPDLGDSRWMVEFIYEACDGAVDSAMNILLAPDGAEILQEGDAQEVARRYHDILRCEEVLDAQRQMEAEKGPFRGWPEADRQAFIQDHGDISETLTALELPAQTDMQYWEIEECAVEALLERGMTQDALDGMSRKCAYVSFCPPVGWSVTFTDDASGEETVVTLYPENGQIVRTEIQEPSSAPFFEN